MSRCMDLEKRFDEIKGECQEIRDVQDANTESMAAAFERLGIGCRLEDRRNLSKRKGTLEL